MYERALEIRELIKKHEEAIRELNKELREFRQPIPVYTYRVAELPINSWNKIPGALCIVGTLENKADFDLFLNSIGFMYDAPKESVRSAKYFRTEENVLTHEGGGYLLLKDCCLCTDEEWEGIKKGNFEKFMNTK
jgi:hypothetical protein